MNVQDACDTLALTLTKIEFDEINVQHRLLLLSEYGSSYFSFDRTEWVDKRKIQHLSSAPYHPETSGKIERWHEAMKDRILLNNYYLTN